MHRAAPASRASGRYAVGLPADPGHRRLTRRAQTTADNGQTTTNTTTRPGLDRPRSFRNDTVGVTGSIPVSPTIILTYRWVSRRSSETGVRYASELAASTGVISTKPPP